jgi:hypothetical protein
MPGPIRIPVASLQRCILASHPKCTKSQLRGDLEAGLKGLQGDGRSWGYGRDCANDVHINYRSEKQFFKMLWAL